MNKTLKSERAVAFWLFSIAALVLLTVIVGGLTRLTGSGLSITEWKPITGALPPFSRADWLSEFAEYQKIPQFSELNPGMTLAEFKYIYWWEWGHRQIGRFIGFAFLAPMIYFFLKRRIPDGFKTAIIALFFLGGLQGLIGWLMVKSGLSDRVTVSQYRLAAHLGLATLIYAGLLRTGLCLYAGKSLFSPFSGRLKFLIALIGWQILSGAFTAGAHAGHIYNTWPLIDGAFIPDALFPKGAISAFEDLLTIQFIHRFSAYCLFITGLYVAVKFFQTGFRREALLLTAVLCAQMSLGIYTLIAVAPVAHIELASAHQLGAFILLTLAICLSLRVGKA